MPQLRAKSPAKMRYTKGIRVEIHNKKEVLSGSWKPAVILYGDGRTYRAKYDWPSPGALVRRYERVPRRLLRPRPPQDSDLTDWLPGDVLEVLNLGSWKIAEVLKTVGQSRFSVRLLGSFQTLEGPRYILRMRHIWENDRWVPLGKDFEFEQPPVKGERVEKGLKRENKGKKVSPAKKPRKNGSVVDSGRAGLSDRINSSACSSSGSNDPNIVSSRQAGDDHRITKDAGTSCWSMTGAIKSTRRDGEDKLHELELQAYRTTMEAFHHSGFVTWEQEWLMSALRRELHISEEEHIFELRNLFSRFS